MLECHDCRLRQVYHALTAIELRRRRQTFRPWICQNHGRDLFQYLFYADEDAYDSTDHRNTKRSRWAETVFPKGQSEFYGKGRSVFEEDDDEGETGICFSARVECKPISSIEKRSCISHVTNLLESLNVDPFSETDTESVMIREANRRWFEAYSSDPEPKRKVPSKCVHFPDYSPVTSVHNLITYSCASRLQRADRTWEIDAMRRETPPPEHKAKTPLCDEIMEDGFTDEISGEADIHVSLRPLELFPPVFSDVPPVSESSCTTLTLNASLSFPKTESKSGIDSSTGLLPDVISCELTVSAAFPKRRRRRRKHRNRTTNPKPPVPPILSDLPCISLDWPSCSNTFYSEQMRSLDSILSHEMCSFPITASCCYVTPNLAKSQKYF
ncbi:unnamed protein product [Dibothriocephalus latus]|uniref:Uncharacterized protein n=1 Tax=Dibothriocephalus latus TaxID=60516 RepID=A0A3P7P6M5_DIBLA|nr:unnamed protein product [Dibothriocephalus latus]